MSVRRTQNRKQQPPPEPAPCHQPGAIWAVRRKGEPTIYWQYNSAGSRSPIEEAREILGLNALSARTNRLEFCGTAADVPRLKYAGCSARLCIDYYIEACL